MNKNYNYTISSDMLDVDDVNEAREGSIWDIKQLCSIVVSLDDCLNLDGKLLEEWEAADDLEVFLNKFYLEDAKCTLKDYLIG